MSQPPDRHKPQVPKCFDNYLVDNHSCVIVGVQATAARMSQETVAAQDMLTRFTRWQDQERNNSIGEYVEPNGG